MAKKYGFDPFILLSGTPGDDVVTGGGTGQSTTDPYPCDYDDWLAMFAVDYDNNGFDENDYRQWFQNMFGSRPDAQDLWELCGNEGPLYP